MTFITDYLKEMKKYACTFFLFASSLAEIIRGFVMTQGIAWGVKGITDGCLKHEYHTFRLGICIFVIAIVSSVVAGYVINLLLEYKLSELRSRIRTEVVKSTLYNADRTKNREEAAYYDYMHNVGAVADFYKGFHFFMGSFGKIVGGYIAGVLLSWPMTGILVLFGIAKYLMDKKVLPYLSGVIRSSNRAGEHLFNEEMQYLEGIEFFKHFAKSDFVGSSVLAGMKQNYDLKFEQKRIKERINLMTGLVEIAALLSVIVAGAALVKASYISLGTFAAFISMYDCFVNPYRFFSDFIQQIRTGEVACRKIFDRLSGGSGTHAACEGQTVMIPKIPFTVKADHLSFAYHDAACVFRGLDFSACSGDITYIVGRSGVGKSTFAKVLCGMETHYEGELSIVYGAVKKSWNPALVTYVSQDPFLFMGSVFENIALDKEARINWKKMWRAVACAKLEDVVGTEGSVIRAGIDDEGRNFSGGEKCRIALARAFYNPTPILILDEVFASLDNLTAAGVQKSIEELKKKNVCILIINHRMEWSDQHAAQFLIR